MARQKRCGHCLEATLLAIRMDRFECQVNQFYREEEEHAERSETKHPEVPARGWPSE